MGHHAVLRRLFGALVSSSCHLSVVWSRMPRDSTTCKSDMVRFHESKRSHELLTHEDQGVLRELQDFIDRKDRPNVIKTLQEHPHLIDVGFGYYGDVPFNRAANKFDEPLLLWMLQQGSPALAYARKPGTPYNNLMLFGDNNKDLVDDVLRKLIVPAALLEMQALPEELQQRVETRFARDNWSTTAEQYASLGRSFEQPLRHLLFPEPTAEPTDYRGKSIEEIRQDPFVRQFMRSLRLTRTWDSHMISMPRELIPYRTVRHWDPLLQKDFVASNGYHITCLTNSRQLSEEGDELQHCVGKSTYDLRCCADHNGRSHILSVRDANGNSVSTAEVQYYADVYHMDGDFVVAGRGHKMNVLQHHGQYNGNPPREAAKAFNEFLEVLQHSPEQATALMTTGPAWLGERIEKRESNAPGPAEEYFEFTPSWAHLERIFNEFRRGERRASTHYDSNHKLVYDDAIDPEDPQKFRHSNHLIDGYVCVGSDGKPHGDMALDATELKPGEGERVVPLRDLGFRDWLQATGMMELIHNVIEQRAEFVIRRQKYDHEKTQKGFINQLKRPFVKDLLGEKIAGHEEALEKLLGEGEKEGLSGERSPRPEPRLRRRDWREHYEKLAKENTDPNPYFDRGR